MYDPTDNTVAKRNNPWDEKFNNDVIPNEATQEINPIAEIIKGRNINNKDPDD